MIKKIVDSCILDFGSSFHLCPYQEWFDTSKKCYATSVWMGNNSSSKAIKIDTMKVKMFDGITKTLSNVKHVPKMRRNLTSLGGL